jgi:hypothetical protein
VNCVKTTEAELRGARTQNMTMICRNRELDIRVQNYDYDLQRRIRIREQ